MFFSEICAKNVKYVFSNTVPNQTVTCLTTAKTDGAFWLVVWRSGNVVSRINEVTVR